MTSQMVGVGKAVVVVVSLAVVVVSLAVVVAAADDDERKMRLFGVVSSTSVTLFASVTVTSLTTCLSVSATPCLGRRKRDSFKLMKDDEVNDLLSSYLDSSHKENHEADDPSSTSSGEDRTGKAFTIWTSFFTTLTITSTVAQGGTTITASALCSAPGLTAGCFLG
ncbi:uncharacterized protein LOC121861158 [Homarus americanus]|uniref:uncharacterized protein LOC121861158 n=1 Tax=Homarus americanus TaxID=6706 RepID=UPI001C43ABE9|nr:uncharacterized protein LOC121861158 [Homarus americanus]